MSTKTTRIRLIGLAAVLFPMGLMFAQPNLPEEWSRIDSTIAVLAKRRWTNRFGGWSQMTSSISCLGS